MQVNVIIFGQLTDITGSELSIPGVTDTNSLVSELNKKYPLLIDSTYIMAVNRKVVTENTGLTQNCTVALLSPFSGG
jgi:molybdopterin converting factor small subunit